MEAEEEEEKLYVAVPEKSREGMSVLLWVLRNAPKNSTIVITHVYILDQMIPLPLGGRVRASIVCPVELVAYRQKEKANVTRKLDDYVKECSKAQFKSEKLVLGSDDVAKGILELIALKGIKKLIIGAAEDRRYSMRMIEPASTKAKSVMNKADPSCKIWFVCKGNLIFTREANQVMFWAHQEKPSKPAMSPENYTYNNSSISSPGTSRISDAQSLSMSEADDGADNELQDALVDLTLIIRKVEDSIYRQKHGTEHEIESLKVELSDKDMLLQEANKQNLALEARIEELEENNALSLQTEHIRLRSEEEQNLKLLQDTIIHKLVLEESLKGLGDSLAAVRGRFELFSLENKQPQQKRDKAATEFGKLHKEILTISNDSSGTLNSEFSLSELQLATENFSDLKKVGEGGFGCVYKGFLHNTIVAVKLYPQNLQYRSQFEKEAAISSRLKHPNLVKLIGPCSEASALVYEFLPNGSLEDRLTSSGGTPPLTWQTRTRIIGELCSVLIYLHSNKPDPVVHGDLKPDNILLDANFVSKLSDFGISRVLIESSSNNTYLHGTFQYVDPEIFTTGTLTTKSDVYSFGIIVLRLLTGKPARNIMNEVEDALENDRLHLIIDKSAGDWPFVQAKQLVELGMRCANLRRRCRPDLESQWEMVEPLMKAASLSMSASSQSSLDDR